MCVAIRCGTVSVCVCLCVCALCLMRVSPSSLSSCKLTHNGYSKQQNKQNASLSSALFFSQEISVPHSEKKKMQRRSEQREQNFKKEKTNDTNMSKAAAAASSGSNIPIIVTLFQRDDIKERFQHKDVVVGLARPVVTSATSSPFSISKQDLTLETVAVRGRLDVLDPHCNVTLSNAQSPALGQQQPCRAAALRGAAVQFIGIPKQQ